LLLQEDSMHRAHGPNRRAFTLTEILVVVAILSLLAALVMPTFGLVVERARRSACAQNLGIIYAGMLLYEQENESQPRWVQHNTYSYGVSNLNFYGLREDGAYASEGNQPDVGFSGLGKLIGTNPTMAQTRAATPNFGSQNWPARRHYRYVKDPKTFFCPSQIDPYMDDTWWKTHWETFPFGRNYHSNEICYSRRPGTRISYGIPNDHGFVLDDSGGWHIVRWFSMQYPAHVFPYKGHYAVAADATGQKSFIHTGHLDGANVAYNDGSVHYFQDDNEMLTTNNNMGIWDGGATECAKQVNAWNAFDDRYNP
jgi:prepilin-type N-terminal cleavage/methylation domain-containing protein